MVGALSDIGSVRKVNEDYIGFIENGGIRLYIVADGIGGHNAGEVASKTAVEKTLEYMKLVDEGSNYKEELRSAIQLSNDAIFKLSEENKELIGMGTTITACLISKGTLYVANIGDSSCFVIRNGEIAKITKDHSLVQELIDEGSITEVQARNHPNKNIITRALGTSSDVEVDIYELSAEDIEKVILCTDGLTDEVSPFEMLDAVKTAGSDNMDACRELIGLVKARGGRDNISVMIFEGECRDDRNDIEQ